MALDLKMQIFAFHCFSRRFTETDIGITKKETLLAYGDECTQDETYTNAWDFMFHKAITCRYNFFTEIYTEEIDFVYALQVESLSDFNSYVNLLLDSEHLFGDLNVFERMFATCALAHHLTFGIYKESKLDVIKYSDLIWAMYFDKFAEKFYKEGGWKELRKVAKTYDPLYNFLFLYPRERITINLWKEALENYHQFKNTVKHNCSKKSKDKIHISLLWIKFQTEHFEEHITVSSSYVDNAQNSDIEHLFQELKRVLQINLEFETDNCKLSEDELEGKFLTTKRPNFETLHNSEETKTDDDLRVLDLTMNKKFCEKSRNVNRNFKRDHESEISTSDEKEGHAIMDRSGIFEAAVFETEVNLEEFSHNVYDDIQDALSNSEETKTDDDLPVLDLTMNKKFCEKSPNKRKFKTKHQEILTSDEKVGHAIMDKSGSFETTASETETPYKEMEVNLEEYSHNVCEDKHKTLHNSEETKTDDDLRVLDLTMYKKFCEKSPNVNNFTAEHRSEILTSDEKVGHAIMDKSGIFETVASEAGMPNKKIEVNLEEYSHNVYDGKDSIEIERFGSEVKNLMKSPDFHLNHDCTSIIFDEEEKVEDDAVSSRNAEIQSEVMNPDDVLSTNQKQGPGWFEHIAPKNASNSRDSYSENEIFKSYQEENGHPGSLLGANVYSKNVETCNQNAKLICASTLKETAATFCEKNKIPEKNLSSTEDCLVTNEVTKNSDGKINTNMELDKLRGEQEDPEMVFFLRMILVLGDRQGIRQVRETLQSNKEDKKNSSKKSKKNRLKKKSEK